MSTSETSSNSGSLNIDDTFITPDDISPMSVFKMEKNMNEFGEKLKELDKEIMDFSPDDNKVLDKEDLAIYKQCKSKGKAHPAYHIFNKIKVCKDSQQHGKEFERNMKILISLMISKEKDPNATLGKVSDKKIIEFNLTAEKLKIKRDDGTKSNFGTEDDDYPLTNVFFLPHTEHQNDEKDIDTNQLLTTDTKLTDYYNSLGDNPIYKKTKNDEITEGVRSHWGWDFDKTAYVRGLAIKWFGSGINIKCSKTDGNIYKWNGKNTYLPKAVDCAKSTTFYNETMKDEDWIFAIGVWEQNKDVKCIKGIWFIKMTQNDHQKIWGYEGDTPKEREIFRMELFEEIKTFQNKINNLARFNSQPWKKLLHYYGSISKVKKRLRGKKFNKKEYDSDNDKWIKIPGEAPQDCWDDTILEQCEKEKGNVFDGGCLNLHNKIKSMFKGNKSKRKSLIAISPKVQGTEPQNRVQCSMTKTNLKKFLEEKKDDVIWCDASEYPFLCKPITSSSRKLGSKDQKGGMIKRVTRSLGLASKQSIWDKVGDDTIDTDIYNDNNGETYLYNVEDNTILHEDGGNENWVDIDEFKTDENWIQQDEIVKQDVNIIDSNVINNAMLEELRDNIDLVVKEIEKEKKNDKILLDGEKIGFKDGVKTTRRRKGLELQKYRINTSIGFRGTPDPTTERAMRQSERMRIKGRPRAQTDGAIVRSLSASNLKHIDEVSPKAGKGTAGVFEYDPRRRQYILPEFIVPNNPVGSPKKGKTGENTSTRLTIRTPRGVRAGVPGLPTVFSPPDDSKTDKRKGITPTSSTTSSKIREERRNKTVMPSAFKSATGVNTSFDSTNTNLSSMSEGMSEQFEEMSISSKKSSDKSSDKDDKSSDTSLGGGKKKKRRRRRTKKKRRRKKKTRYRR